MDLFADPRDTAHRYIMGFSRSDPSDRVPVTPIVLEEYFNHREISVPLN